MLDRLIRGRRPSPALIVASLALILAMAGVGVAAIPDAGGTVHACYAKNPPLLGLLGPAQGTVRVVDPAKGQACADSEAPVALGGPPAAGTGGVRAYVSADADGNILPGRSKNVVSVTAGELGDYCVMLAPSIPIGTVAPLATINLEGWGDIGQITAAADGVNCPGGISIEIRVAVTSTMGANTAWRRDNVPFSVLVP